MSASVINIYIAPTSGAPMVTTEAASVEAGKGIVDDRYYSGSGKFSEKLQTKGLDDWQITLIEAEEIEAFCAAEQLQFDYSDFRRNVLTRGIRLNDLVDKKFAVGNIELEGVRLCEPCNYLAGLLTDRLLPAMVGRSGLRARILTSGTIRSGDQIKVRG